MPMDGDEADAYRTCPSLRDEKETIGVSGTLSLQPKGFALPVPKVSKSLSWRLFPRL